MSLNDKLLFASIALMLAGLKCLPWSLTNVKHVLSSFDMLASAGWLASFGLAATGLGLLIGVASLLLRR
jgi:hypothetical protein